VWEIIWQRKKIRVVNVASGQFVTLVVFGAGRLKRFRRNCDLLEEIKKKLFQFFLEFISLSFSKRYFVKDQSIIPSEFQKFVFSIFWNFSLSLLQV
jgi:hypothetical protein